MSYPCAGRGITARKCTRRVHVGNRCSACNLWRQRVDSLVTFFVSQLTTGGNVVIGVRHGHARLGGWVMEPRSSLRGDALAALMYDLMPGVRIELRQRMPGWTLAGNGGEVWLTNEPDEVMPRIASRARKLVTITRGLDAEAEVIRSRSTDPTQLAIAGLVEADKVIAERLYALLAT